LVEKLFKHIVLGTLAQAIIKTVGNYTAVLVQLNALNVE